MCAYCAQPPIYPNSTATASRSSPSRATTWASLLMLLPTPWGPSGSSATSPRFAARFGLRYDLRFGVKPHRGNGESHVDSRGAFHRYIPKVPFLHAARKFSVLAGSHLEGYGPRCVPRAGWFGETLPRFGWDARGAHFEGGVALMPSVAARSPECVDANGPVACSGDRCARN